MNVKKIMIILGTALILIAVGILVYWRVVFSRPNPPLPTNTVTINGATFTVEIASTTAEQTRGLSYRPNLDPNAGLLFLFGKPGVQNFWMKDMNFPIDIIWIGDGKVAGFVQNAPIPKSGAQLWQLPIYTSPDGVDTVLEVNAGVVAKNNIKVGDVVEIRD